MCWEDNKISEERVEKDFCVVESVETERVKMAVPNLYFLVDSEDRE